MTAGIHTASLYGATASGRVLHTLTDAGSALCRPVTISRRWTGSEVDAPYSVPGIYLSDCLSCERVATRVATPDAAPVAPVPAPVVARSVPRPTVTITDNGDGTVTEITEMTRTDGTVTRWTNVRARSVDDVDVPSAPVVAAPVAVVVTLPLSARERTTRRHAMTCPCIGCEHAYGMACPCGTCHDGAVRMETPYALPIGPELRNAHVDAPSFTLNRAPLRADGTAQTCDNAPSDLSDGMRRYVHPLASVVTLLFGWEHYLCAGCADGLDASYGAPIGPEMDDTFDVDGPDDVDDMVRTLDDATVRAVRAHASFDALCDDDGHACEECRRMHNMYERMMRDAMRADALAHLYGGDTHFLL